MPTTYKLTAYAPKPLIQAALLTHDEVEDWDPDLVIAGREVSEDRLGDWVLEAWYPRRPGAAQKRALAGLFEGDAPAIQVEKLAEEDWLALSQQGAKPIRAGPFYVHTPDYPAIEGAINFAIPAAQAFGTGQHATTAGCLEMLAAMKASGMRARAIADIGTGTGLLAFAALSLWPPARVTASDIDAVCAEVVADNAAMNDVALGARADELTMVVAPGLEDPLLTVRGPYDLLIANILAAPLIELAEDFAAATAPGASLLLAGLLHGEQEAQVRRAYRRAGFRLAARLERGDWAILWLRRRRRW
ncbi:50S ribosomal protein L11 methyltransferase [Erythrobacter sp.]|uniref:50S ribosomal protein L11 methyltransferase n=1 Tax=Erythrobacter sp. TaxID=1042 RepID=UPI002EC06F39|nr:50S ribosomal protein L11 methyltransferase [Erythrobacter sp.]